MVAPKQVIEEARALRRLMLRHPPTVNQRQTALFLSLGHHDALIHRLHREFHKRWETMDAALQHYLPASAIRPSFGGTSFWVRGPENLDAEALAARARAEGVLIEPGRVHFLGDHRPHNYFRLAFSSIATDRITPGVAHLDRTYLWVLSGFRESIVLWRHGFDRFGPKNHRKRRHIVMG